MYKEGLGGLSYFGGIATTIQATSAILDWIQSGYKLYTLTTYVKKITSQLKCMLNKFTE